MSGVCINEGKQEFYGVMDPQLIHALGNKKIETQTYITNNLVIGRN